MTTFIIKTRRDTAAGWTSANPTLNDGEMGLETDTGKTKVGDGDTPWTDLGYLVNTPGSPVTKVVLADQTVNNEATLQGITDLTFKGDVGQKWVLSGHLWLTAAAGIQSTTGFKIGIGLPAGATARGSIVAFEYPGTGVRGERTDVFDAGIEVAPADAPGEDVIVKVDVIVEIGATAGDVQLQFAQQTAHASDLTLLTGSAIDARLVI